MALEKSLNLYYNVSCERNNLMLFEVSFIMQQYRQSFITTASQASYNDGLRAYMLSVFNYMAVGLSITGFASFLVAQSPALMSLLFGTPLQWVLMFAPLVMVLFLSAKIPTLSLQQAQMAFWTFAGVMGVSLASIFLAFTGESIVQTFFITASVFGAMSLYGYTTKKDLTSMGSFMVMGLFGVVIASLANLFLQSPGLQFVVSLVAVIVFTVLTAYDVQNLKATYNQVAGDNSLASKVAIYGALGLYMNFINLFLHLLHFFGDRK
jgi:FtsH-binding integral membrane protein